MAIDGYFIHYLVKEFQSVLTNIRIKKIKQIGSDQFYFQFHKGVNQYLVFDLNAIKAHVRIDDIDQINEQTSPFLVGLKKHLENALLVSVEQYLMDRVISFHFTKTDPIFGNSNFTLIFEIMGKANNLILLDDKFIIVDAFYKQFQENRRSILVGNTFSFFPSDKKELTPDNLNEFYQLSSPKEMQQQFMGLSIETASFFYNHPKDPFNITIEPSITYETKKKLFLMRQNDGDVVYPSLSAALKQFYQNEEKPSTHLTLIVDKLLKKQQTKLNNLNEDLNRNLLYDTYKDTADYIYTHCTDLNQYLKELGPFTLDPKKTLNENAQMYYQKYHKAKKALTPLKNQIELTQNWIAYFEGLLYELGGATVMIQKEIEQELTQYGFITHKSTMKVKKTFKYLHYTKDQYELFIGLNSAQNAYLTHEVASYNDTWLHVQKAPGSHVILRGSFTNADLRFAAMLAAYHSSLKLSSTIPVDYTLIKYVKKIKGLPGNQVTYDHQKTLYVDIDLKQIETLAD